MSTFEYVTVLLSIVVGLGITRLLGGLGRAIEIRKNLKFYWVHGIWMINVGLYLIVYWWVIVFGYQSLESWLLINFIHLLLYAVVLYLQTALIIPMNFEKDTDLEAHYYTIRPWFFSLGALLPVMEISDSLMHGLDNLLSFGAVYIILQSLALVFHITAVLVSNRYFHAVYSVLYLIGLIGWTVSQWWKIE